MLTIYTVSLQLCRDCVPIISAIARHDRNLADQLRRAVTSVALNIAESDGQAGGNRKQRRLTALGSVREVSACIEIGVALSYVAEIGDAVKGRLNHVTGTLVNLTRR
jgi:four helix bundle protein